MEKHQDRIKTLLNKIDNKFIEEYCNESTLYINSHSDWAYKVPEKKIVSLSSDRVECR